MNDAFIMVKSLLLVALGTNQDQISLINSTSRHWLAGFGLAELTTTFPLTSCAEAMAAVSAGAVLKAVLTT